MSTDSGRVSVTMDVLNAERYAERSEAKVAVIMLTIDQCERTLRALRSLGDDVNRFAVLVWDNGSSDGTADAVAREFPGVTLHRHATNLGVASGRNAGAALARDRFQPTHFAFLDNDLVLDPGFLDALLEPFAGEPLMGQTQAKLRYLHDPERINDGGGCRVSFWLARTVPVGRGELDRGQRDSRAPCVSGGGAMMVRADLFEKLGGFDQAYDPFGPEDLDFSLRLQGLGYRSLYVPQASAYHEVGHSYRALSNAAQFARLRMGHWVRFARRHGTRLQRVGFMLVGAPFLALRMSFRELVRGNPRVLAESFRGFVEALRESRRSGG
jgi:GT2 family glycosyltransferase